MPKKHTDIKFKHSVYRIHYVCFKLTSVPSSRRVRDRNKSSHVSFNGFVKDGDEIYKRDSVDCKFESKYNTLRLLY